MIETWMKQLIDIGFIQKAEGSRVWIKDGREYYVEECHLDHSKGKYVYTFALLQNKSKKSNLQAWHDMGR